MGVDPPSVIILHFPMRMPFHFCHLAAAIIVRLLLSTPSLEVVDPELRTCRINQRIKTEIRIKNAFSFATLVFPKRRTTR